MLLQLTATTSKTNYFNSQAGFTRSCVPVGHILTSAEGFPQKLQKLDHGPTIVRRWRLTLSRSRRLDWQRAVLKMNMQSEPCIRQKITFWPNAVMWNFRNCQKIFPLFGKKWKRVTRTNQTKLLNECSRDQCRMRQQWRLWKACKSMQQRRDVVFYLQNY